MFTLQGFLWALLTLLCFIHQIEAGREHHRYQYEIGTTAFSCERNNFLFHKKKKSLKKKLKNDILWK